jgi:alpha-tubulin suppressor-like RCC1 family protein
MLKLSYFESKNLIIKKITAGARHTLVLTKDNQVFSFGDNSEGQCTGENKCYFEPKKVKFPNREKIRDIYAGYNYSVAIGVNGNVYSWGDTNGGKLGYNSFSYKQKVPKSIPFMSDKEISEIYTGYNHTALVVDWEEDKDKKIDSIAQVDDYGSIDDSGDSR